MAELAGDFGKLRLPPPKTFSGEPSDWEDGSELQKLLGHRPARFPRLLSTLRNFEPRDCRCTLPADEAAAMRMFSRKLHYLLANLCAGSARLLVRPNEAGNGFET